MARKVIKLKESDITNIVKKILREDSHYGMNKGDKSRTRPGQEDYTGHKGDISKTHKGRDYEKGGKEITWDSMLRGLGNPKTLNQAVDAYEEMYRASEMMDGVPTPEEFAMKADEIEDTGGGGDPVAMIIWWWIGVGVALGIRWINTGNPPWSWSDVTLKENIELVGKSKSGINIYEFDYINKKYGNGRYRGVMAQEVPSATRVGVGGKLMVNYSKIDVNFEKIA